MQHPVSLPQARLPTRTCVWMDAGLLAYKLCDRGFDCAHCPLDAALRGDPRAVLSDAEAQLDIPPAHPTLPSDRLYTTGHAWLAPARDGGPGRVGMDAFAAALIGVARGFRHVPPGRRLGAGDPFCAIELPGGSVPIGAPTAGRLRRWNTAIDDRPSLLPTDPYGDGWLAEWTPDDDAPTALLDTDSARRQASLDARRYRRRVAFRLLADADDAGPAWQVDTDVRRLLGHSGFVHLLKELVH